MGIPPPVESTDDGGGVIVLDEEIEGDLVGSRDYRFCKIGEAVSVLSDGDSKFDPECLPFQALAVSERFRLLFVAHPQGFCVARTKDVMASAEDIKEKQTGPSVQELSLVDVSIGKVSILALSADDSLLAATVGSRIDFFAVSALLHKEQKPSYSVPLEDSSYIKDMRWARQVAKSYVILSDNGKLFHGLGQGSLSCVMEGVDSVDWSVEGDFVAVAKENAVSILSSQFKIKITFSLLFQSVIGGSDVNLVMKVDSIRWIRPDCIAVGCFQLNDDGEEENYIVQLITSRGRRFTDAASKPVVLSFNSVFIAFCSDAVPARKGSHLFVSYLDRFGLAFVAHRSPPPNVGLFCWSLENGENKAAIVDILNDLWNLHIDYQGNDEENVILGLSVDKVSQNENIKFMVGDETEVPPCCIFACLTIDGKISLFHFASAAGDLRSSDIAVSDKEDYATQVSMKHEMPPISSGGIEESIEARFLNSESRELSRIELKKTGGSVSMSNQISSSFHVDVESQEQFACEKTGQMPILSSAVKVDDLEKSPSRLLNQVSNANNQSVQEVKSSTRLFSRENISYSSHQATNNYAMVSHKAEGQILAPLGKAVPSATGSRHSLAPFSDSQGPLRENVASGRTFPSELKDWDKASSPMRLPYSMQNAAKQFGNVEEMAKELDYLLECIEGKGGFRDASITSQTKSVIELEDHMRALSGECRAWKGLVDEKVSGVQLLLDKTVQVLVRKVYMEGIFKQVTDSRYWELWNRQKLTSELELKQRRILELNQELTNKLIELERHFNALEFNKFGENGGMQRNQQVRQSWQGKSRQIQSFHSLHSTMNAQLAAAEQLSGCLAKQMAALSIQPSGKHDVKKNIFESIGLPYVGDSHGSPGGDATFSTPDKKHLITAGSIASEEHSRRNQVGFASSYLPETARRHRDSLDRSWASFETPKATVKRIPEKGYEKGSANRSLSNDKQYVTHSQKKSEDAHSAVLNISDISLNRYKSKGTGEMPTEHVMGSQTSLLSRTTDVDSGIQAASINSFSASPSSSILEKNQNSKVEAFKINNEKPNSSLRYTGRNDSIAVSESTSVQQSDASSRPLPSIPSWSPGQSLTSPSDSMKSSDRFKIGFTKPAAWDKKNTGKVSHTPLVDIITSVTSESAFPSGPNLSEVGVYTKSSEKPSQPGGALLAPTASQPAFGSSLFSSNTLPSLSSVTPKPSPSTLFPMTPPSSVAGVVAKEASQQQTPIPSSPTFPFALPSLIPDSNLSSISLSSTVIKQASLTSLSSPAPKAEAVSEIKTEVVNTPSKIEKDLNIQASASQPGFLISQSSLKLGSSASSVSTDLSNNSKPTSENDLGGPPKSSFAVASTLKSEEPHATEALSPFALSNERIVGSLKDGFSDDSHEVDMEEEAPEASQTTEFALGSLHGFAIGSNPNSTTPKSNPFGVGSLNKDLTFQSSSFMMSSSSGELFKPASFNFESPLSPPVLQPTTAANFSGGFSSGNSLGQASAAAGFGQPAHIGAGQQALGSVLGSFGQSRQLGAASLTGSNVAPAVSGFGSGFSGISAGGGFGGGFSSASTSGGFGGGFSSASTNGGFASLAAGGGGFAAAATAGGGFAAAANVSGGFAAAASAGGGFSAAAGSISGGGFAGFGNQQGGGGGFSAFTGSSLGTGRPPSELFTQMRK